MSLQLRLITQAADPVLPEYTALMEELFPPEERETTEELIRQIASGQPWVNSWAAEEDGRLAGLARGKALPEIQGGWIVHIGLKPQERGGGQGERLFRLAESALAGQVDPYLGTVVEVERLEDARTKEEEAIRAKRLAWFSRLGAIMLTPAYIQPPSTSETPAIPLNLMWVPALGAPSPTLNKEEIVIGYYRGALDLPPDHPYVAAALAGIAP